MATRKKQYAVITDATSVLGRAYAFELAKREINLVLISSCREELEDTSCDLKDFDIDVRCYETDLSSHQNLMDVAQWINLNFEVALLINLNNIGAREPEIFRDSATNYPNSRMQLKVMSVSLLTQALLPNLIRQRKSYILNVSDITLFNSWGLKTRYPSWSTFVKDFTRRLSRELKDTNIFISGIYIAPMQTNMNLSHRASRILEKIGFPTSDRIAIISIRRLFRRQRAILPGVGNSIGRMFVWLVPIWIRLRLLIIYVKREANGDSSIGGLEKN